MVEKQIEKKETIQHQNPTPLVKAPADFTEPEELYKELLASIRRYHPSDDLTLIEKAYALAKEAHGTQYRKSGEPYIIHPIIGYAIY